MALEKISLARLDRSLREFFEQQCWKDLYKSLSTELRDIPKQEFRESSPVLSLKFPQGLKKVEKFLLLTSVWYFRENPISFYLQLECEKLFGKQFEAEYEVLSSSKSLALGFWLSQTQWNERDFYGNCLRMRRNGFFLSRIRCEYFSKKPVERYTGYCRGYSETSRWTPYRSKAVDVEKFLTEDQFWKKETIRWLKKILLIRRISQRLRMEL